jgi:hypothetical protein
MADQKQSRQLDGKLIENKTIDSKFKDDFPKVHKELNTITRRGGGILDEAHLKKGEKGLRDWLNLLFKQGASQEKLTSYLRCGLAHLCCDFISSTYSRIEPEQLITRSLQSFKKRGYHKSYYKPPQESSRRTNAIKKKRP